MMPQGCFPLVLFIILLILLPLFLAEIMLTALSRLGLSPETSVLAAIGIFMGGLVNIPVRKIPREQSTNDPLPAFYGINRFFKKDQAGPDFTIIAVNFGGCIVPCIIAGYQVIRIVSYGYYEALVAFAAIAVNVFACYRLAKPVPQVGIALPALIPGLLAALCAIVFVPEFAPPVAFCAGVLGPLIGADLFHLQDIKQLNTNVASIGGAGTFDGIVISGLLATLLV